LLSKLQTPLAERRLSRVLSKPQTSRKSGAVFVGRANRIMPQPARGKREVSAFRPRRGGGPRQPKEINIFAVNLAVNLRRVFKTPALPASPRRRFADD
jgi:hypothetical protein